MPFGVPEFAADGSDKNSAVLMNSSKHETYTALDLDSSRRPPSPG